MIEMIVFAVMVLAEDGEYCLDEFHSEDEAVAYAAAIEGEYGEGQSVGVARKVRYV